MLCESLANWNKYDFGPVWREVMGWLATEGPTAALGRHEVAGCGVFMDDVVTKRLDSCLFETHRRFTDVQVVYSGAEWLYTADAAGLALIDPFDADKDIGYHVVPTTEMTRITLHPGVFTLLFPWDAHMPLVAIDSNPVPERKAVAKIPTDLLKL